MRKWFILVAFAMVLGSLAIVASCGETDPAQAPAGAGIEFVAETGDGEAVVFTLDYGTHEICGIEIPDSCQEAFYARMEQYCVEPHMQRYPDKTQAVAEAECKDRTVWCDYTLTPISEGSSETLGALAAIFEEGECGYYEQILVAIVSRSSGSSASTDVVAGVPLNGVEVRWVTQGPLFELYELSDVPGEIPPLANPYMDETDDRGITELKVRFPLPIAAGSQIDRIVTVDIGVDVASYKFTVTTEEGDTSTGDDDDATDDDAG
ncbi:MAG: hypothetical protein IT350_08255 [Deltaproteobacteria bacterium]|nr:hypothetical protein [Deltaproteobacteria bacterium]